MYLHNTTFVIDNSQSNWWQAWMRNTYLPAFAEQSGALTYSIYKIDGTALQEGATSYSLQWHCPTIAELAIVDKCSRSLAKDMTAEKGEACLAFSTYMKKFDL